MGQSVSESDESAPSFFHGISSSLAEEEYGFRKEQAQNADNMAGSLANRKLLFLMGTTGSGKTTLLRHWGLIHDDSFLFHQSAVQPHQKSKRSSATACSSQAESSSFNNDFSNERHPVWTIMLIGLRHVMSTLIRKQQEQSDIKFLDRKCLRIVKKMDDMGYDVTRNKDFVKYLFQLARDPSTLPLYRLCQTESILQDGFEQILTHIDWYESILTDDSKLQECSPGVADVLYTIHRSNSWSQPSMYYYDDLEFSCTDYGNCPSVRKRFASEIRHLVCDANIYVFCAGVSDYYKRSFNDASQSAISESLTQFEDFENRQGFRDVPFIFVLTKTAMLEQTLQQHPLSLYFPEYTNYKNQNKNNNNNNDCDEKNQESETERATDFIKELYLSRASQRDRITVVQVDLLNRDSVRQLLSTIATTLNPGC